MPEWSSNLSNARSEVSLLRSGRRASSRNWRHMMPSERREAFILPRNELGPVKKDTRKHLALAFTSCWYWRNRCAKVMPDVGSGVFSSSSETTMKRSTGGSVPALASAKNGVSATAGDVRPVAGTCSVTVSTSAAFVGIVGGGKLPSLKKRRSAFRHTESNDPRIVAVLIATSIDPDASPRTATRPPCPPAAATATATGSSAAALLALLAAVLLLLTAVLSAAAAALPPAMITAS
mmetsp:Transcript_314/g.771  ORF Transcript_314/g.771 Transcript_314/m.771 type:complete len:235 (+) Transcript_314:402-1106(+)